MIPLELFWPVPPLVILAIGMAVVLGLIIGLRVNAFLALITAAIIVSLLAEGEPGDKIRRVAVAFGSLAGNIGIVIATASIIGKCMLDSGAADRVVRAFVSCLGEKRSPLALMSSGYVLSVPVFFDTVFYLLVPLARSLYRRTGRNYLLYLLAICVGGALTHTLVPPTPGPLTIAATLRIDIGLMMLVGGVVAIPSAILGLLLSRWFDATLNIPMRQVGSEPDPDPLPDSELPPLWLSLLPVVLPVLLISSNTIVTAAADAEHQAQIRPGEAVWDELVPLLATRYQQQPADVTEIQQRVADRILERLQGLPRAWASVEPLLDGPVPAGETDREAWREVMNARLLPDKDFYSEEVFLGVPLPPVARQLLGRDRVAMKPVEAERLNRLLLETVYPDWIEPHQWYTPRRRLANYGDLWGDASLALLLSALIAMATLKRKRRLSLRQLGVTVEAALMSAGVIILITAGGGAFGAMLKQAGVGDAIRELFPVGSGKSAGLVLLLLGYLLASVIKVAQGSSTVAMITAAGMLIGIADPAILGFHQVYLGIAIGAGSLVGSWMNDSGFWVYAKMGGLTELEALKSWTPMLAIIGTASLGVTMLLAWLFPLTYGS